MNHPTTRHLRGRIEITSHEVATLKEHGQCFYPLARLVLVGFRIKTPVPRNGCGIGHLRPLIVRFTPYAREIPVDTALIAAGNLDFQQLGYLELENSLAQCCFLTARMSGLPRHVPRSPASSCGSRFPMRERPSAPQRSSSPSRCHRRSAAEPSLAPYDRTPRCHHRR